MGYIGLVYVVIVCYRGIISEVEVFNYIEDAVRSFAREMSFWGIASYDEAVRRLSQVSHDDLADYLERTLKGTPMEGSLVTARLVR